jgi:cell division protein FtsW
VTTTGERSTDQAGKGAQSGRLSGPRTKQQRAEPVGLMRRALAVGRRNLHDWLDRPMTSLHLVLAIFLLLLTIGLLMVLSSSSVTSYRRDGSSFAVFQSQILFAALGLPAFVVASRLPLRVIRGASTAALLISLGLLVAVLLIGRRLNGSRSWIGITNSIGFQPSELAKLALLLWAANVLASRRSNLGSLRALLIPLMPVSALTAVLIMLQPDFGTTVTLAIVLMAVLYFAGAPLWLFGLVGAGGAAAMGYLLVSAPYRMARLQALLDPEKYPDSSYQLRQALYGMGNGGWFGVGLGQSRAKWSWLPNADSDFIFAIIGEELGLIGAVLVLILFGLLAYTGMRIARRNVDPFVKIVAGSATVWLVCQAAINIGYVVGLLPTTGLTLPMISAGGTSLVVTMIVFGLLANFARREPQAAAALTARGPGTILRFLGIGAVRADREIEPAKKVAKRQAKQAKKAAKQVRRTAKAKAAAAQRATAQKQNRPTNARAATGPRRPAASADRQPARRAGSPGEPRLGREGARPAGPSTGRSRAKAPQASGAGRPRPDPAGRAPRPAEQAPASSRSARTVDPRRRPQPGETRRGEGGR